MMRPTDQELCLTAPTGGDNAGHTLRVVTTSWDDGDPSDIKIADLLRSRKLAGTFYVPITGYRGRKTLAHPALRALSSEGFEIGAHSFSHKSLTSLSREELGRDVATCKERLEQIVKREVSMFCYPKGRYDRNIIRQLKQAGYKGARTTRMLSLDTDFTAFEIRTTVQAYPHPKMAYVRNLGRAGNIPGLVGYLSELRHFRSWVELGKQFFDRMLKRGGIWHLYGHSWEIEQLGIWADLQEMLDYVNNHAGVIYATNGQLLRLLKPSAPIGLADTEANKS
jgi:peptidoglycan-N-acetylglucosamine deacetylase